MKGKRKRKRKAKRYNAPPHFERIFAEELNRMRLEYRGVKADCDLTRSILNTHPPGRDPSLARISRQKDLV